jgi:hypothetical protein
MMRGRAPQRDWENLGCYDAEGEARLCTLDSDHGAIRVTVTGERDQFFELRRKREVDEFRVLFDKALGAMAGGVAGDDFQRLGVVRCYSNWGEVRTCVVETGHDVARVTCVDVLISKQGEQYFYCFLELRGQQQAEEFRVALDAAITVFHDDIARFGEYWADEGDGSDDVLSRLTETTFAEDIERMVKDQAPHTFALVEEIGDRVDVAIIAWGMAFRDRVEVVSNGPGAGRGVFLSAERARTLLADTHHLIRLVWA